MKARDRSISLIIEWENVQLSEADRAARMLRSVSRQINALCSVAQHRPLRIQPSYAGEIEEGSILTETSNLLPFTPQKEARKIEVIVTFNPEVLRYEDVDQIITTGLNEARENISLRLIEVRGEHYYQMKNIGARNSSGEMLVFLDSDVIPCDNWLEDLLTTFDENPDVKFVGGSTYIDPVDLYSKAFALFWFFPLPPRKIETVVTSHFFANNFACYREVLERTPFPKDPKRFRTQCQSLIAALREVGIDVYRNTKCTVSHPPPNGFLHFINRSICQGSDRYWLNKFHNRKPSFKETLKRYKSHFIVSLKYPVVKRNDVQFRFWEIPVAMLVGITYYTFCFIGEMVTFVKPDFVKKHFSI